MFTRVHEPVAQALTAMGREFRGLMYAGLMVDDAAVNVLEFNCRFGDPESQAVLPRIEGDLLAALAAAASGEPIADGAITWREEATVAVAMASGGYPGSYATGAPITGLDAVDDGVEVFHAGTALDDEGRVVTPAGACCRWSRAAAIWPKRARSHTTTSLESASKAPSTAATSHSANSTLRAGKIVPFPREREATDG